MSEKTLDDTSTVGGIFVHSNKPVVLPGVRQWTPVGRDSSNDGTFAYTIRKLQKLKIVAVVDHDLVLEIAGQQFTSKNTYGKTVRQT